MICLFTYTTRNKTNAYPEINVSNFNIIKSMRTWKTITIWLDAIIKKTAEVKFN